MTALDLGGTLFLPATHKNAKEVLSGKKYPYLKSVLLDTEDALDDLESGLKSIENLLKTYKKKKLLVFIRPRKVCVLKQILLYDGISAIDGFILPKFSLDNGSQYLNILKDSSYFFMPSIEGSELFEQAKLSELRTLLLPYKKRIPLVRFGLEDMLSQLHMRRNCEDTIFDFAVTSSVLGNFIAIFKSSGFDISGGVYPCFRDKEGFIREVKRDLKEGLVSKTLIHPNQVEILHELYKIEKKEYEEALEVRDSKRVIFSQNNKMAEKMTMRSHANKLIRRAEIYGLVD